MPTSSNLFIFLILIKILTTTHDQALILYTLMDLLIISWNSFSSCPNDICVGKILGIVPVSLHRSKHTVIIEVSKKNSKNGKKEQFSPLIQY